MYKLIALTIVAALALPAFAGQDEPCPETYAPQPHVWSDGPLKKEPGRIIKRKSTTKKPRGKVTRRAHKN